MCTQVRIDAERVIQPLTIINGSLFNLVDCGIDLSNYRIVIILPEPTPSIVQIGPSRAQIA
jgi:hypothetical protein